MAGFWYYYTGRGAVTPFIYTRNNLIALIRANNHLFNPPLNEEELQDEEEMLITVGAAPFEPNKTEIYSNGSCSVFFG